MRGRIEADLADAQDCKAADMIKFLLAFCQSEDGKTVPIHNEGLLQHAFEKAQEVANKEHTPLRTNLNEFLNAKKEEDMYGPFVAACNNALDDLSRLQVEGLPHFSEDDRIVFVRIHEQSIQSRHSIRKSWPKPDIVLMSWELFNGSKEFPYSTPDEQDLFIDESDSELVWSFIRSTVEIESMGSPKHDGWKLFDTGFGALIESESYTSLAVNDDSDEQPQFIEEDLPDYHYPSPSSDSFVAREGPVTTENTPLPGCFKRKAAVLLHTDDSEQPVPKRNKSEASDVSIQSGEYGGKGVSGSSQPPVIPKEHPVDVQSGIYAAERLSCSPEITHSINFILRGTTIYITWSDRQSVIRTGGFNIIDNLPHFLLILLIIQRFNLARWGFFTGFEGSEIDRAQAYPELHVLEATFTANKTINVFPQDDPVHIGINLVGRSTSAMGARDAAEEVPSAAEDIRNGNNMIVKFSWPEETRTSEVEVIEKAKRIGETNKLVGGHIPEVLGNMDPPYLTCSTSIIRKFLGLDTAGARVLRVIVFSRLEELGYLDEEDMLMAFLDCFFCHWALWCEGIQHGDISIRNLMYNPVTKRGVLNDFDLARICAKDENGKPSGKDNTGTIPFMALDLLLPRALQGMVPHLYRHDAESFAWCLIYICICTEKRSGTILVPSPHPLQSWFETPQNCRYSKVYKTWELFEKVTIHERSKPLAMRFFNHWVGRFHDQQYAEILDTTDPDPDPEPPFEGLSAGWFADPEQNAPEKRVYKEPSERESFERVFQMLVDTSGMVPKSKIKLFVEKMQLAATSYESVTPPGPVP